MLWAILCLSFMLPRISFIHLAEIWLTTSTYPSDYLTNMMQSCAGWKHRKNNQIQPSAVIMRSYVSRCYIRHCENSGKKLIRYYNHNRHTISRPHGRAMECLLWGFWIKLNRVITILYFVMGRYQTMLSMSFRTNSVAMGHEWPSTVEASLKWTGELIMLIHHGQIMYHQQTKHGKTICIFYEI